MRLRRTSTHCRRPCGCAAHQPDEHTVLPGRAWPSQTLPPGEVWGNPVSPDACSRAAPSSTLLRAGTWGNPVSPHPSARAAPSSTLLGAGTWGNPVSPDPSARAYLCLTPFLPPVIMLIRYRQGLARPAVRGSCRRDLRVSLTQSTRRCRSVIGATRSPPRGEARRAAGHPRTGRSLPVAAMRPGAIPPSPPPRAVSRGMRGAGLPSPLHRVDPVSERQACLWSGKMKTKESSH